MKKNVLNLIESLPNDSESCSGLVKNAAHVHLTVWFYKVMKTQVVLIRYPAVN